MVLRSRLKFLGGLLIAFLVLGILLAAAGYFAVRNIDPNMFRAEFEKYLTEQTGFRAELGDIKFQWRPRPELRVAGLKFYHPQSLEKILQSDQVRIDMDLTSLWQKRFRVSEITIQSPRIFLRRDRGGVWNWQIPVGPVASVPAPVPMLAGVSFVPIAEASEGVGVIPMKNTSWGAEGWEFGIGKILVRDATVHFADEIAQPAYKLEIEKLEAEVRQRSPGTPFHFTAGGNLFKSPLRNLEAEGDLDLAAQSLDLLLRYGPDKAVFKGLLKMIRNTPHFEGTLEVTDLDIEPLVPAVYKEGDYLTGRLSAKAQIAFDGANPDMIRRSLAGQGTVGIRDGALRNRNVVKEVFDRLTPVLAITNALGGQLPPEVNEMLKDRDTPFESLQVAYAVQSGLVRISQFRLAHPNYQLAGQGTYGIPDKRVEGSMQLQLSQSISGYLMKKIREMELIADPDGRIMIPFRYSGVFPETSVQPDLADITSRLLRGGAGQLLNHGFERLSKILGSPKNSQAPVTDPSAAQPAPASEPTAPQGQVSGNDLLIQQGLALFEKYREAKKK